MKRIFAGILAFVMVAAIVPGLADAHRCVNGVGCDPNNCPDDGHYHLHINGVLFCESGPGAPCCSAGPIFTDLIAQVIAHLLSIAQSVAPVQDA